jgi:hypothetical protein
MILKSDLIDGQWYWGTALGTLAAQWHSDIDSFVFGKRVTKANLLDPAMPPVHARAAYYHRLDNTTFAPIEPVSGPTGDWKPEQGVMLTNNLRAIYNVPDLGGL